MVIQEKFNKNNNGKDQNLQNQQAHPVGKGFVEKGGGSQRDQEGQGYQDQSPVLDDVLL